MGLKAFRIREYVHSSLWVIPALCSLVAFVLAKGLLRVDAQIHQDRNAWYLFGGGADSARGLLQTIAASMITFTGVVFSITMLVLQLASQQFSPRILRTFLRDVRNQIVPGTFVSTFLYALLVLGEVRSAGDEAGATEFVPSLSAWVALLLIVMSIAMFVTFIDHIAQSIRAVTIMERVAGETRDAIERMYPQEAGDEPDEPVQRPPGPPDAVIPSAGPSGVLLAVDGKEVVELACRVDGVLSLVPMVGDFVPEGGPLFEVWGDRTAVDRQAVRRLVSFAEERTMEEDVAFGLRQLVDIAERALSPAVNDPTTAVQAIDQLHDPLRRIARRKFPSPSRLGNDGRLRAILPRPGWEDYVHLAVDEIRLSDGSSMQVHRRLRAMLIDLHAVAPATRRSVLVQQLDLLDAAGDRGFMGAADRALARTPSLQGHSPSPPVGRQRSADAGEAAQAGRSRQKRH